MGINKIKLKQIDADFPVLVGQYGSGYFASTGSLNALSGQSVKYSDLSTGRFVYSTGNQDISGIKNFISRPTLSGSQLAKLEEVVTLDGDETINGFKDFSSDVIFHGNVSHELGEIAFTQNTFNFDPTSIENFVTFMSTDLMTVKTQQSVTGIKVFTNGIRVGGNGGSGVLHSGQINPIYVSGVSSNLERYSVFVEGTGSGFKFAQMETGFSYNPSSKILKSTIFSGNLSGLALNAINSTGAVNASGVYTSGNQSLNTQMYPAFAAGTGNGFQALSVNSGLSYNPSTNVLSAQTFSGNISGRISGSVDTTTAAARYLLFTTTNVNGYKDIGFSNVTTNPASNSIAASTFIGGFSGNSLNASSSSALEIGTAVATSAINFQFPAGATAYIMNSGAFYATPATGANTTARNLGLVTNGWNNVFTRVTTITSSDKNLKTEISEIPDLWLDAWEEVNYVKYKFKDAVAQKGLSGARWHIGHIAQDIYESFNKYNLNAFDIGMLCYDKWDESVDQNGNITPSGEIWSIRPDECQFMELALMRRSLKRLKSGILI
jgi:hypothetical protein